MLAWGDLGEVAVLRKCRVKFFKLRFAWSVAWSTLAVAISILWVRSYWTKDTIRIQRPRRCYIDSTSGIITSSFWPSVLNVDKSESDWIIQEPNVPGYRWWFRYYPSTGYHSWYAVNFPHWFVILISVITAAIPWLGRQFGLRDMFVVATLLAGLLGLAAWASRRI